MDQIDQSRELQMNHMQLSFNAESSRSAPYNDQSESPNIYEQMSSDVIKRYAEIRPDHRLPAPHTVRFTRRRSVTSRCVIVVVMLLVLLAGIAVAIYFVVTRLRYNAPITVQPSSLMQPSSYQPTSSIPVPSARTASTNILASRPLVTPTSAQSSSGDLPSLLTTPRPSTALSTIALSQLTSAVVTSPGLTTLAGQMTSPTLTTVAGQMTSPTLTTLAGQMTSPTLTTLAGQMTSPTLTTVAGQITSSNVPQSIASSSFATSTAAMNVTVARLSGALSSKGQGRIEVMHEGQWGTVCKTLFSNHDATVLCRMVGYFGTGIYTYSRFGPGDGPIWLSSLVCVGNEASVDQCEHDDWGANDCQHKDDVSISCS